MKRKLLILVFGLMSMTFINAQIISVPELAFDGTDFGALIEVPINTSGIDAAYGDIITATIKVEFDTDVLTYTGYTNLHPDLDGNMDITINPDGSGGVLRFNMEGVNFLGLTWPDGKMLDMQFTYHGGACDLNLTQAEFLSSIFIDYNAGKVNGSVSGFASITGSDGDYNTKGTWTGEFGSLTKPGPGHNVTINTGGTVTIDADAAANSVTIASGGQLTLNAAKTLTVAGDFTVQSGGSFLQNGTLTATSTKAERAVPAANWANPNSGWHQIASPVAGQAINGDWTPGGSGYDFFVWSEPTDTWLNQKLGANNITAFNVGQGYMVAYEVDNTKTFTGAFNTADVPATLSYAGQGGTYNAGANLLGNPYPVALTWENNWIPGNVQGTAYIWSGSAYTAISVGNVIPAMNGFMVLTTTDNNPITIPAASRAHNAQAWHKSTMPGIKLIANDLDNGSQQEAHIKFNPQATEAYDLAYDAFYLSGYAPQLYTMTDQSALMVNSMPAIQEDTKIPLYFEKTEAENFSIQLAENSLGPVYLKDLKTNTTVKLSEMIEYHFTAEAGDSPDRFEVFFSPLGVDELTQTQAGAYARNNTIVVYGLDGVSNVELYNLAGQLLYASQTSGTAQFEINAGLKQGVYIVKLSSRLATNSVKVFIR